MYFVMSVCRSICRWGILSLIVCLYFFISVGRSFIYFVRYVCSCLFMYFVRSFARSLLISRVRYFLNSLCLFIALSSCMSSVLYFVRAFFLHVCISGV